MTKFLADGRLVDAYSSEREIANAYPGQENSQGLGYGFGNMDTPPVDLTTYSSFSGSDIVVMVTIPDAPTPEPLVLATLRTISYSTARSNKPLRLLGSSNPATFARGGRLIAGTLVFTSFDRDIWYKMNGSSASRYLMSDMLPAFDITITALNEYGMMSRKAIQGVRLVDEGGVIGVDELYIEQTHTWVAISITPWIPDEAKRT